MIEGKEAFHTDFVLCPLCETLLVRDWSKSVYYCPNCGFKKEFGGVRYSNIPSTHSTERQQTQHKTQVSSLHGDKVIDKPKVCLARGRDEFEAPRGLSNLRKKRHRVPKHGRGGRETWELFVGEMNYLSGYDDHDCMESLRKISNCSKFARLCVCSDCDTEFYWRNRCHEDFCLICADNEASYKARRDIMEELYQIGACIEDFEVGRCILTFPSRMSYLFDWYDAPITYKELREKGVEFLETYLKWTNDLPADAKFAIFATVHPNSSSHPWIKKPHVELLVPNLYYSHSEGWGTVHHWMDFDLLRHSWTIWANYNILEGYDRMRLENEEEEEGSEENCFWEHVNFNATYLMNLGRRRLRWVFGCKEHEDGKWSVSCSEWVSLLDVKAIKEIADCLDGEEINKVRVSIGVERAVKSLLRKNEELDNIDWDSVDLDWLVGSILAEFLGMCDCVENEDLRLKVAVRSAIAVLGKIRVFKEVKEVERKHIVDGDQIVAKWARYMLREPFMDVGATLLDFRDDGMAVGVGRVAKNEFEYEEEEWEVDKETFLKGCLANTPPAGYIRGKWYGLLASIKRKGYMDDLMGSWNDDGGNDEIVAEEVRDVLMTNRGIYQRDIKETSLNRILDESRNILGVCEFGDAVQGEYKSWLVDCELKRPPPKKRYTVLYKDKKVRDEERKSEREKCPLCGGTLEEKGNVCLADVEVEWWQILSDVYEDFGPKNV